MIGNRIARPKVLIFMALVKHSQRLSAPSLKVASYGLQQGKMVRYCVPIAHVWQA